MKNKGILLVLSGPSGTGKGTIANKLIEDKDIVLSISATTRLPRDTEIDGKHYYFKSKDEFFNMLENNKLLEYAEYCGNYYGTPEENIDKWINEGKTVILEIETVGALKVKQKRPDAVLIFISPPSIEEQLRRLKNADTGVRNDIEKRIEKSREELKLADKYDYVVINDSLDRAVNEIKDIINKSKNTL